LACASIAFSPGAGCEGDIVAVNVPDHVEIVSPKRFGQLAAQAGSAGWIEDKVAEVHGGTPIHVRFSLATRPSD
jgi:hypothetical protein